MTADPELPLEVDHSQRTAPKTWWIRRVLYALPVCMAFFMAGGIVGLYAQPPGMQKAMQVLQLEPGGGTNHPIAVPLKVAADLRERAARPPDSVRGLGRLTPNGDVLALSTPYGAGDARVASMAVKVGDRVKAGAIVARLDNEATLESNLEGARATLEIRRATLKATRASIRSSRAETQASLERAESVAKISRLELERGQTLWARNAISESSFDRLVADATQADREVERTRASMARYQGAVDNQPDVVVTEKNLEAAEADVRRAERELDKAYIRAPIDGTVIKLHVQAGERPGAEGVLDMGDLDAMKAELEIYQSQIGLVRVGQHVQLEADAVGEPLTGEVSSIGLEVGRQTLMGSDPASNTDARVVEVVVDLDAASSLRAASLTNLQVVGAITTGTP